MDTQDKMLSEHRLEQALRGAIMLTREEVASYFDVHVTTVTAWVRQGAPVLRAPGGSVMRFKLPSLISWLERGQGYANTAVNE